MVSWHIGFCFLTHLSVFFGVRIHSITVHIIDYPIFIINSDRIFAFSVLFFYLFTWLNILAAKLKFISFWLQLFLHLHRHHELFIQLSIQKQLFGNFLREKTNQYYILRYSTNFDVVVLEKHTTTFTVRDFYLLDIEEFK